MALGVCCLSAICVLMLTLRDNPTLASLSSPADIPHNRAGGVKKLMFPTFKGIFKDLKGIVWPKLSGHSFQRWLNCSQAQSKRFFKQKTLPTIPKLHHYILISGDLMVTSDIFKQPSALHLICRGWAQQVNLNMWQILPAWNLHSQSGYSSIVNISYTFFCVQPGKSMIHFGKVTSFQLHSRH